MKKKINLKLSLNKKEISNLNDISGGENPDSITFIGCTIFITKYCGTANCTALCVSTLCQTREDSCLICPPETANYCS